jgi:hypothetical protein
MNAASDSTDGTETRWQDYVPATDGEDFTSPPEIRTELPLPSRPGVKATFALLICASVLGVVWIVVAVFQAIGSGKTAMAPQAAPVNASEPSALEKLEFERAMRNRVQPPLRTMDKPKTTVQPRFAAAPRPAASRRTAPTPAIAPATATVAPALIAAKPVDIPLPSAPVHLPPQRFEPLLPLRPPIATLTPPPDTRSALDLIALASGSGIYSSNAGSAEPVSFSESETGDPEPRTKVARSLTGTVPATTRVKAKVATAIAWVGSDTQQTFRLQLSEPLIATDGTPVLPQNTHLTAKVVRSDPLGYVDVAITSALVNGQELPITPGTLIVQGTTGEPLQAKVKSKGSGFRSVIVNAGLTGLSKGLDTLNSPTIFSSGNSSTVTNNNPNVAAGIGAGITSSLANQGQARLQRAGHNQTAQPVLLLKEGMSLELFVNRPFSL